MRTGGQLLNFFTAVPGAHVVTQRFKCGAPDRFRMLMKMEDALHFANDPALMARAIALFKDSPEARYRIEGLEAQGSGAVFDGVTRRDLAVDLRVRNGHVHSSEGELNFPARFLWGLDFGFTHAFGAVLVAWDGPTDKGGLDRMFVLDAIKMTKALPAAHAARIKLATAPWKDIKCAWPHDGEGLGDRGTGATTASLYRKEGLPLLPTHATHKEGGFKTMPGVNEMVIRARTERLFVAKHLTEWFDEMEEYHFDENGEPVKEFDDLLSATRIAQMSLRFSGESRIGEPPPNFRSTRSTGSGPQMAAGVDFDLFA
jgi:hypothetical protein